MLFEAIELRAQTIFLVAVSFSWKVYAWRFFWENVVVQYYRWNSEYYPWSWENLKNTFSKKKFQKLFWAFKTAPLHLWMRKMDSWQNSTSKWLSKKIATFFFVEKIFFENEQTYFSNSIVFRFFSFSKNRFFDEKKIETFFG